MIALLRFPEQRGRLQDDPSLIGTAVDEFLRYESPIQLTDRVAKADCEIGGQRIRRGQMVAVVLAAANRDPAQFSEPDRLDVGRRDNPHLAFGQGNHYCLGCSVGEARDRARDRVAAAPLSRLSRSSGARCMAPIDDRTGPSRASHPAGQAGANLRSSAGRDARSWAWFGLR